MGLHIRLLLLTVSLIFLNVEYCSSAAIAGTTKEVEVITEPKPGEEYVLVQTANSQPSSNHPSSQAYTSHQIPAIKEKQETTKAAADDNLKFKTSHKISRPAQVPAKHSKTLTVTTKSDELSDKKRDARETSKHDDKELTVSIEDEGQTGIIDEYEQADSDERKILARKAEPIVKKQSDKKETSLKSKPVHEEQDDVDYDEEVVPRVAPESETGTIKKPEQVEDEEPLPKAKQASTKKATEVVSLTQEEPEGKTVIHEKFEIVSLGSNKSPKKISDDGTYDFVDTPLNDKILKPSGSSQASRVNIKKAPNGQDYEYEYVYYYYDDDEDPKAGKGGGKNTVNSHDGPAVKATTSAPHSRVNPTTARNFDATELPDAAISSRNRRPEFAVDDAEDNLQSNTANAKQRYTTIERTKGHQNSDQVISSPTTPEPASNEVLPTRGSRFRGRQLPSSAEETIAPVSEERLPANTRFPPRSRSNHNPNPTTPSPLTDSPITRVRGNSGSVKRPSLELVDSSSFRTHASDVSPDQDQGTHQSVDGELTDSVPRGQGRIRHRPAQAQATPQQSIPQITDEGTLRVGIVPQQYIIDSSKVPVGTTREQDLEEYIQPQKPAIRQRVPATELPYTPTENVHTTENYISTPSLTTVKDAGMTDKAAYDLYAILQQTQSEEANSLTGEPATSDIDQPGTTDVDLSSFTHVPVTTTIVTQPPTTTTTSTTTTTTTTTTTPEPPAQLPGGRGRYRGNGNVAPRNRVRPGATTSTTTTTEASEEGATKRTRFQPSKTRIEGQVSAYGRRGSKKPVADQSESGSNVEEEVTPKSSTRGRYKSNNRAQNSVTTTEASASATTEGRHRPSFGTGQFNSRRRPGNGRGTANTATHHEEEAGHQNEGETTEASSATTTARPTRPRLNIASGARPLRPGPKINIPARGRIGVTSTQAPLTTAEQDQQVSTSPTPEEQPAEVHEQPAEVTTAAPDALTRLRNRPRLRVGEKQPTKPQATPPVQANRRQLVPGLLPKRPRPNQATEVTSEVPAEAVKPIEEHPPEESEPSETPAPAVSTTEQPAAPESRLSSLIGNRRRIGGRRPGTLIGRPATSEDSQ